MRGRLAWLLWAAGIPLATAPAASSIFFQKGVNFTAEFPGGYASQDAVRILEELSKHGVNAVALVPYGFARREEASIRFPGGMERDEHIEQVARAARKLRMKVLLKPQLWVRRGFPGDLDFPDPAERARFFEQYTAFLEHYARLAARINADLFAVGVELGKLAPYEKEWRRLIERARQLYSGPLTYAANSGPEFETLAFWDALDYIGLNNYYPLPDSLDTAEVVRKVEAVQRRFRRPVIFPEAGYSSFEAPHRQPWDETPRKLAPADQARCYEALMRAFYRKPWFQGVYWWKVGTNGRGGAADGSHTPWKKPAMDVVARWYRTGGR